MPLYNQTNSVFTGPITTYQRAEIIVLRNQDPLVIECHESLRSIYPSGDVQNQPLGILRYTATDMEMEIPLIDPETFEPVPGQTFTAGQFYLMVASIYMHLARERDDKALAGDEPPVIDPVVEAIIAAIPSDPRWPA